MQVVIVPKIALAMEPGVIAIVIFAILGAAIRRPRRRTHDPSVACNVGRSMNVRLRPNSALLSDAFSSLRCACGAAKRER